MSEQDTDSNTKRASGILTLLNSKIGKLTALFLAIVALLGAVEKVFNVWSSLFPVETTEGSPKDCFKSEMMHPSKVSISAWPSMTLRMTGRNDCSQTLSVHVAFKARGDRIRIEPPYPTDFHCRVNEPDCWEQRSLKPGDFDWKVGPPDLTLLKKPLGDPVFVRINWVVYNAETKTQLWADNAEIEVHDDPEVARAANRPTSPSIGHNSEIFR